MKKFLLLSVALVALLLLATCEREWSNPFDPNNTLDPEAWAPETLQIETTSITERQLTWTYSGPATIQGFKIDRKKGDEAWQVALATLPKETRTWNDTTLIPQTGLTYQYRIYTYAGNNSSAQKTTTTPADFPAPSDLTITKLTEISYKLEWKDNSSGEQGFKIDRKTGEEDWVSAFGVVAANVNSFIDTNVILNKNALQLEYQVYGFLGNYTSASAVASTQATLSTPGNLQLQVNSQSSITISWSYNGSGHQGFKIDRKTNEGAWQDEFAVLSPSQTSFTDNTINLDENAYRYRVYSYLLNNISEKAEKHISKPTVTTGSISNVTGNSANGGGNVTDDGGSPVTQRGVCWSTSPNPTTANQKTIDGSGTGSFVSNITGLSMGVTYYVRAYAINAAGTSYGVQISFTTLNLPTVTTANITDITWNSAMGGGNVTADGGSTVTQRGICWSTNTDPTIANQTTNNGSGTGRFSGNLSNLNSSTDYYVRAYATNAIGTSYGNQQVFTTTATAGLYVVNFEGEGEIKTSYASATVNLSGLNWDMTEALITTIEAGLPEFINGQRAARMRGYGTTSMTMLQNKSNGIGNITFQYRRHGTDAQVDWKVEYSINNGLNWIQIGNAFTAPASDVVQTFQENVNVYGNVRIRIKRATEDGTANRRLTIDDLQITDYTQ